MLSWIHAAHASSLSRSLPLPLPLDIACMTPYSSAITPNVGKEMTLILPFLGEGELSGVRGMFWSVSSGFCQDTPTCRDRIDCFACIKVRLCLTVHGKRSTIAGGLVKLNIIFINV